MIRKLRFTYTFKYTEAIIKLLQWCKHENINLVYNMVEVEP